MCQRYSYRTEVFGPKKSRGLDEALNRLAAEGWEVYQVHTYISKITGLRYWRYHMRKWMLKANFTGTWP